jgi:hypothetical protein
VSLGQTLDYVPANRAAKFVELEPHEAHPLGVAEVAVSLQRSSTMARQPRIGLACPNPGERAALMEWLSSAGYDPVPMIESESITRELAADGFEALVVDSVLVTNANAVPWLRSLGSNRPLIIVGDVDAAARADAHQREASYLARPFTREMALMTLSLALAEGRPARRSRRRNVARIPATADEAPSFVVDVSYEGIRLEIPANKRSTLPPFFKVQVPLIRVGVIVQRVWVANAPPPLPAAKKETPKRPVLIECGVTLKRNSRAATDAWRTFVDNAAPASSTILNGRTTVV